MTTCLQHRQVCGNLAAVGEISRENLVKETLSIRVWATSVFVRLLWDLYCPFYRIFCLLNHFVYFCSDFYRVTTFLENLEMSGNLTAVGEMLGNWSCQGKVRRKSCE